MSDTTTPEAVEASTMSDAQNAVADAAKVDYLAQTKASRDDKTYTNRHAAYDRRYLRFIEGTTADTAAAARDLAKGLGHEGDHIETRPV